MGWFNNWAEQTSLHEKDYSEEVEELPPVNEEPEDETVRQLKMIRYLLIGMFLMMWAPSCFTCAAAI